MDIIYSTSHHLYDSFLSMLIGAGIKDPSEYLPGPFVQICIYDSPQRGSWSLFPSMENPCYEAPWLWFVILLLLPWLSILSFWCLYKLISKTIKQFSSTKSDNIKVRIPGPGGPITPQSPTFRRDSADDINPFLHPVEQKRDFSTRQARAPGYLPAFVPDNGTY